jgi:SAM-dependent methyltransferase
LRQLADPATRRGCSARTGTGHHPVVPLNPPGQYVDDRNLRARQRFWEHESPIFDIAGWVLDLAGLSPGMRVLDAGCGNGVYLRALAGRAVRAVGCDLSMGMLRAAGQLATVNADVGVLPLRDGAFDLVLAIHMLYHVPDRVAAIRELRRVLAPGGVCIAVTNGARQLLSLRSLTERAVRQATPDWQMRRATHAFTAENGAGQLAVAFRSVTSVQPASQPPVVIRDASLAGDFVASWATFYQDQTTRPWPEVAEQVQRDVRAVIDREGAFITSGDLVAFVCR